METAIALQDEHKPISIFSNLVSYLDSFSILKKTLLIFFMSAVVFSIIFLSGLYFVSDSAKIAILLFTVPTSSFMFFALLWFAIGKVNAIQKLLDITKEISNGDLESRVPLTGESEFDTLGKSFNDMVDKFQQFVPSQFIQKIGKTKDLWNAKPVEEKMTLLFSDIRAYTSLSETMNTQENFDFLNSYLSYMEPAVSKNKGFVDKFIGDGIMAVYDNGNSANNALASAIEMQTRLKGYNRERKARGFRELRVGIGLNTGVVKVGLIGTKNRMESTVIGDQVNLAARMESLTKIYDADILISENTYNEIDKPKHLIREVDRVKVKGREKPVTVYEIFDTNSEEDIKRKKLTLNLFNVAMSAYKSNKFMVALDVLQKCRIESPNDKLYSEYIKRCEYFIKYPPVKDWDGVIQNTHYSMTTSQSRKSPRFEVSLPIEITPTQVEREIFAESKDISPSGIKAVSRYCFDKDEIIKIKIKFKEGLEPITLMGRVTWSKRSETDDMFEMGFEFLMTTREQEKLLQEELWDFVSKGVKLSQTPYMV